MVSTRWLVLAGGLAAVALLAFGGWWFLLKVDAPPPLSLADAVATASNADGPTAAGSATATATVDETGTATVTAAPDDGTLEGTWVVNPDASIVGYRIQEELSNIGAATAVGRTSDVEGSLEFDGTSITSVSVTADLRTLQSDDSRRDGQLSRQALETNTYPEATFVLTEPIAIEGDPTDGQPIAATAVGDFTIHGVTNRVELPLEGQYVDGHVVIVGATVILLADYDIDRPTAPLVLSVSEEATMEMQLVFVRG